MKAATFKGQNIVLAKDQPQYNQLPVCYQGGVEGRMTSCWKLSWKERIRLFFTGRFFITQVTFNQPFQPILPEADWKEPHCINCGKTMGVHQQPSFFCPHNLN